MKKNFLIVILLSVLLYGGGQDTSAKTWIEDFNQEGPLKSWVKHGLDRATWQSKDGHLDVWIEPLQHHAIIQRYALEFKAFPLNAEKLSVKMTIIESQKATAGIFIGQGGVWEGISDINGRSYKFFQGGIWEPIAFPPQLPKNPFVHLAAKKEIEILFNNGDFQLLSEGKHIIDFHEPNLPTVDCLGIVVGTTEDPLVHLKLDDFIISGPSIPSRGSLEVDPGGKAAVLWGELKQK